MGCEWCGISEVELGKRLHRHHIVSRRLGGSDDPSNISLLCASCHGKAESGQIPWYGLLKPPFVKLGQIDRIKSEIQAKEKEREEREIMKAIIEPEKPPWNMLNTLTYTSVGNKWMLEAINDINILEKMKRPFMRFSRWAYEIQSNYLSTLDQLEYLGTKCSKRYGFGSEMPPRNLFRQTFVSLYLIGVTGEIEGVSDLDVV